jgi:hypothetical protein
MIDVLSLQIDRTGADVDVLRTRNMQTRLRDLKEPVSDWQILGGLESNWRRWRRAPAWLIHRPGDCALRQPIRWID